MKKVANKSNNKRTKKSKKYNITVIRSDIFGNLKYSKPCADCIYKMKHAGIKKVTYSTGNINTPYCTEKISIIQSEWISCLQKSIINNTFRLKS